MGQQVTRDTQAILLLCGNPHTAKDIPPLKLSEWKRLVSTLREKGLTPSALLEMSRIEIAVELGYDVAEAERISELMERNASLPFEVSKHEEMGINLMSYTDGIYPSRLKQKLGDDCPPILYYAGDVSLLRRNCVGFVGSRDLVQADANFEYSLVAKAVQDHYVIVSGGAKGADAVSREAAQMNGGQVIEFLPGALLTKLRNSEVAKAVRNGDLLLLTAVNPEQGFTAINALSRNRYIYAQADATIVIKSINQGGTWNGALDALKHRYCPVFCWDNQDYVDNLALIKNGAIALRDDWGTRDIVDAQEKMAELASKTQQMGLFDKF